jgi:hypothetical protein
MCAVLLFFMAMARLTPWVSPFISLDFFKTSADSLVSFTQRPEFSEI